MKYFKDINVRTNWRLIILNEMNKQYFKNIDDFLVNESNNKIIYPKKEDIFRCFNFFDIEDTNIVIFGQDPYFNENQANGLAFSVYENIKTPPSLKNIFIELENDLSIRRTCTDLSDWAKQGILLMNTILTVNAKEPNSHKNIGWLKFSINIIKEINSKCNDVVFVLLGNQAQKFAKYIDITKNHIVTASHPSPLSCHKGFFGSKIFSHINDLSKAKIEW